MPQLFPPKSRCCDAWRAHHAALPSFLIIFTTTSSSSITMWPLICSNQLASVRCLRHLQFRQFQLTPPHQSTLNVNKILYNIQQNMNKVNSKKAMSKSIAKSTRAKTNNNTPLTSSKLLKFSTNISASVCDKNRKLTERRLDTTNTRVDLSSESTLSNSDFQVDCDSSVDIFKELGLETFSYENLEDNHFTSSCTYDNEDRCDIFEDAHLTKNNLLSFLHVCIYNDSLSEAHSFLLEFIGKFSNSLSSSDIANCCVLLIKGWARKGNTENVRELKDYIQNSLGMKLTNAIYEYYLLSLAKQMKEPTSSEITNILSEMKENGLNPEYLFFKSLLPAREIKFIRDFLSNHGIEIKFKQYFFPRQYKNQLVDNIMEGTKQKYYDPFEGIDLSQMDSLIEQQFNTEMNFVAKVEPISARFYDVENAVKKPVDFYKELISKLEHEWKQSLAKSFQNYLKSIRAKYKRLNGIPFVHYMSILESDAYVEAMLEEIRKCASFSENYSPFASELFETLGRKIMSQYLLRSNKLDGTLDDFRNCYEQYVRYTLNPQLIKRYNPRQYWQHLLENGYNYYFDETKAWPVNVLREIGKDLYEIIANETNFNSSIFKLMEPRPVGIQPVISFLYKTHDSFKTKREIRVNPLLLKLYEGACSEIHFSPECLPMLTPPVPWINVNTGGNLLVKDFFVRPPIYYPKSKLKRVPYSQMYPSFDSINALSLCPWQINTRILDIAIDVFQNKGNTDLDIPTSLSCFGPLPKISNEMNSKERSYVFYKRKSQKKAQAEMYSLWVDCMYKLSIGNYLRDKVFWFPINTDFRSRVYPIPPNFNHLGNDMSRSLLLFAKGKPLGPDGLKWLKMHLINLTGFKKKCSAEERLAYCDEIMDLVMDSADNPMTGQKWWMQSDEKWQTLACCIELTNAIRSGDPPNYVSYFPIHQDGSCNGLQHYAALGRDVLGAKSVNLTPSAYPQDVYSDVAALVEAEINKDIANDVEIAKLVKDFISRKIVKQTVMTYVYGVTKYGAKLQVLKRLKEDGKFPDTHKVTAALYISEKILLSIRKMFTQTRMIQDWFTTCAQIISSDYNAPVEWVTPLGFPVVQAYFKNAKKNSPMHLIPNPTKQKNGFPPNFIHSLDSSHMMLTALECHRNGLTFASVHDCYWTHASQIDEMNYFCRKQFVALHSEPLLDNLAIHLKAHIEKLNQAQNVLDHRELLKQVDRQIEKGDFDLNSVMNSVYFFS